MKTRQKYSKKRSICYICEHFESSFNDVSALQSELATRPECDLLFFQTGKRYGFEQCPIIDTLDALLPFNIDQSQLNTESRDEKFTLTRYVQSYLFEFGKKVYYSHHGVF